MNCNLISFWDVYLKEKQEYLAENFWRPLLPHYFNFWRPHFSSTSFEPRGASATWDIVTHISFDTANLSMIIFAKLFPQSTSWVALYFLLGLVGLSVPHQYCTSTICTNDTNHIHILWKYTITKMYCWPGHQYSMMKTSKPQWIPKTQTQTHVESSCWRLQLFLKVSIL